MQNKQVSSVFLRPFLFLIILFLPLITWSQQPESYRLQDLKTIGIEQFHQGHYDLAAASLSTYLKSKQLPTSSKAAQDIDSDKEEADYFLILSNLKRESPGAEIEAKRLINESINPIYRQRTSFALAQVFFRKNELKNAIKYYEIAGISNLSNEEIADAKFELAYCYFNDQRFDKALPLFAAIKELPKNKYYIAGNYYYGLLAYNNKDYKNALRSFNRIDEKDSYKEIVPYYQAEIFYFTGEQEKLLKLSKKYLSKKGDLYYRKEMQLLTAQTLFEQKKFEQALPYFEYYYQNSNKIRKEELYELAYSYYRLERWEDAIEKFKPLSSTKDSLGQTSMYLLGDCYLKIDDKKGARNAFGICSDMDFSPSQKEAAYFLNAKLSYELGDEGFASKRLYSFIKSFPESSFKSEAQKLLTGLLSKNSNYGEAFAIMSDMTEKDNSIWAIYQQVAVGRAMQLMQNSELADADSILNLSLQQPIDPNYEAIAYFWKGDIAYLEKRYPQAIQYSRNFIEKAKDRAAQITAISQNATIQNAYLNMGYAQLENGNYFEAQDYFSAAQKAKNSGYSDVLAADAILREADSRFMTEDYSMAARGYEDAIAAGVSNSDYASFQLGIIRGLQGHQASKKEILKALIQKEGSSKYKNDAKYELAASSIESGQFEEAIPLLISLTEDRSITENIRSKAQMSLAYAYTQNNQVEKGIENYKKYISNFPSSSEKEDALDALRSIYISLDQPESYADYLSTNKMPGIDEENIETTFYDAATQNYAAENWTMAGEGFTKYVVRFPNGKYNTKAHFYRGESYFRLGNKEKALKDFEKVLIAGWSEFSEDAALRASEIAFENENYSKAEKFYQDLRGMAMNENNVQAAYLGLTKTAYYQNKMETAEAFADTLLTLPQLSKKVEIEALLYKAKALQTQLKYESALATFEKLAKMNSGAASAEGRYRVAEIYLSQNKLTEAEAQAVKSAQTSGGEEYWVVNSYILLADIMKEQKDYFNAKATLQSVIKNTTDKDLKAKASIRLDEVNKLEKANSKLSE